MANKSVVSSRSSPGVQRVATILNFIAEHPGQAFGLTDLVRALKLSRATCHALLTGLVEVGYLYRTSDKTYVMGPALAEIGRKAFEHLSPLQVMVPEMRRLADELDLICTAYHLEEGSVVVRERAASISHLGRLGPLGTRLKLRSQTAVPFLAGQTDEEVERWVSSHSPPLSAHEKAKFLDAIAFARQHGLVVITRVPETTHMPDNPVIGTEIPHIKVETETDLAEGKTYSLASIIVPVIGRDPKGPYALALAGFEGDVASERIFELAAKLKRVSHNVSASLGVAAPA